MVEVNWDVSKTRAEFLAEISNYTRRTHFMLLMAKDTENSYRQEFSQYTNALKTQLMELKGHVLKTESVENERIRKLRQSFENIENNDLAFNEQIRDYEKIDEELQKLRIDLNLDIGTEEKEDIGPEDLYE